MVYKSRVDFSILILGFLNANLGIYYLFLIDVIELIVVSPRVLSSGV